MTSQPRGPQGSIPDTQDGLPNSRLLKSLFREFYEKPSKTTAARVVSSHWRHFGETFDVEVGQDGTVVPRRAQGLGGWKWPNLERRILDTLCIASHLAHLSDRLDLVRLSLGAAEVCDRMGIHFTVDAFRQVCTLNLLKGFISEHSSGRELTFLMIGDGLGMMSGLMKEYYPDATVVLVDIGRTLLFQAYHCQKGFPGGTHEPAHSVTELDGVDFLYCPAEELEHLEKHQYDIAVNIASMQEMNRQTIARYFSLLRRRCREKNLFYCCNRETKALRGGEVTRFAEYPWREEDAVLMDKRCPWHRYFFARRRLPNGPTLFGRRLPLVNYYDGVIRHRLAVLATET